MEMPMCANGQKGRDGTLPLHLFGNAFDGWADTGPAPTFFLTGPSKDGRVMLAPTM